MRGLFWDNDQLAVRYLAYRAAQFVVLKPERESVFYGFLVYE